MRSTPRSFGFYDVVAAALGYAIIGIAVADLAGAPTTTRSWRLAGWVLSLAVFIAHIVVARRRRVGSLIAMATRVGIAVASGALVLAIVGPVRAHWHEPGIRRVAVLSVIVWPLLTGVPAFAVALVAGRVIDRLVGREAASEARSV